MIEITDLDFRYPGSDFRLRVPRLAIVAGEAVALIGSSGSGKTSLLHLVAGIVTPLGGHLAVYGVDVTAAGDRARRNHRARTIGLVFQEFELLEYLTVLDNILLPYRISPVLVLDQAARVRAAALAQRAGIGDKLRRPALRLSQGEKQRVALCRALVTEPAIVLADEPTGNLDPDLTGRVLDMLFAYTRETAATLVTVTHDHDLLDRFDRVVDTGSFHDGRASP